MNSPMKADFLRNCDLMLKYLKTLKEEPIISSTRTMKNVKFDKKKITRTFTYEKYRPSRESIRAILKYLHDTKKIEWDRHHKSFPKITIL